MGIITGIIIGSVILILASIWLGCWLGDNADYTIICSKCDGTDFEEDKQKLTCKDCGFIIKK